MTTFLIPGGPTDTSTTPSTTEAVPIGSALTAAAGAATGHNLDQVQSGHDRFIMAFREKPRMEAYSKALLRPMQQVEDLAWEFYRRALDRDAHEGVWLDLIGRIVLQERGNRTDPQYRPLLSAKIARNNSNGKRRELYTILALLIPGATYFARDYYPASHVIYTDDIGMMDWDDFVLFLKACTAAGVRMDVAMTFGGGPGGMVTGAGTWKPAGVSHGSGTGAPGMVA
jgi:hypothetical protein